MILLISNLIKCSRFVFFFPSPFCRPFCRPFYLSHISHPPPHAPDFQPEMDFKTIFFLFDRISFVVFLMKAFVCHSFCFLTRFGHDRVIISVFFVHQLWNQLEHLFWVGVRFDCFGWVDGHRWSWDYHTLCSVVCVGIYLIFDFMCVFDCHLVYVCFLSLLSVATFFLLVFTLEQSKVYISIFSFSHSFCHLRFRPTVCVFTLNRHQWNFCCRFFNCHSNLDLLRLLCPFLLFTTKNRFHFLIFSFSAIWMSAGFDFFFLLLLANVMKFLFRF